MPHNFFYNFVVYILSYFLEYEVNIELHWKSNCKKSDGQAN